MKMLKVGAGVVAVLILAALGYATYLVHSFDTPEFKKEVLDRARVAVGSDVQVKDMSISVLRGATLRGVTIANPAGFPGPILTAESFSLRHRLLPLLRGRFEVEQLSLRKPVLTLAANARGTWNYERLGPAGTAAAKSAPATAPAPSGGAPLELVFSRLSVDEARILMLGEKNAPLVRVEDANLSSSFKVVGTAAEGSGKAGVSTLNLADSLFVRGISAPIKISKERIQMDPIRGALAGGSVTGILTVRLKGGMRYAVNLEVKGAQVQKLLEEAHSSRTLSGTLKGKAWVEGSGGLATMSGGGQAEIDDCKATNAPVLVVLAEVLRVPELRNPNFSECRVEFSLGGSRLQTPVLRLEGSQIQLRGRGVTSLVDYTLNYDMTLALKKELLDKIPVREMRAAFKEREGGFSAVDFKVFGTSDAPKTDLTSRIGTAAASEAVKGGLGKIFGRKK